MEIDVQEKNSISGIYNCLIKNKNICFKNQHKDEADLTDDEKITIVKDMYNKSKSLFLLRFGNFMTQEQLKMFTPNAENTEENGEINLILANLYRSYSESTKGLKTKNRRYEALKQMISENSYFSETEMMKRNPLLYEQLVGQYLNDDERKQRDRSAADVTLVKLLLEGMERDEAYNKKKQQEEYEHNAMEESDSEDENDDKTPPEPTPSSSRWGEFADLQEHTISKNKLFSNKKTYITKQEQQLLRDEFTTIMYESFLNGQDDFDYATVDNNDAYDNIDVLGHDEEDKYFDSEEPDESKMDDDGSGNKAAESSEDELDIYMNALNQHPTVLKLSKELEKL